MPSDQGRRFDKYQGIDELRHSVEPHSEQTVRCEQPKAVATQPPENDNLMSQGDDLKLPACPAANPEQEQGNESRIES